MESRKASFSTQIYCGDKKKQNCLQSHITIRKHLQKQKPKKIERKSNSMLTNKETNKKNGELLEVHNRFIREIYFKLW